MEDSKSNQEKYLEQIASFDPILNPTDFENILPAEIKASKIISDDEEKSKSINIDTHESPSRVPLRILAHPEINPLSLSHSNVTQNLQLSPENSSKTINDQSPHLSINSIRFNTSTNISSSIGSLSNKGYNSKITSQKKLEGKKNNTRAEYNSVGGTTVDYRSSQRRRSFQQAKAKVNSAHSFKSGRFNITYSSHSDEFSCEENEKKNESKKKSKKEDRSTPKDTTKNIKVKRFNISYSKNSSNDSNGSLISDCDQDNVHLKHANSDKTLGDRRYTDNNTENKLIDFKNVEEDDFFYQMQQSSMPVLGRHKKKGNKDNTNKSNKVSTSSNINDNSNQIIDLTLNKNQTNNVNDKNNSNQSKKQNNTTNNSINININVLSPPKSTPFNPPIIDIDMDSTSTTSSLLGKLGGGSENEIKGHTDDPNDLINLF